MNSKTQHYIFWIVSAFLGVLILFINFQSFHFVENHYQNENFELLNRLVKVDGKELVGYYVGRVEDIFVGPATSVVTHVVLAVFVLLYLKNVSSRVFCFAIFFFLILTKFNILFYPPYGDAIGGPFSEALWLAEHNFDYEGLFHQPAYHFAGPRVYFFSIYPTYLAILLKLIPNTKAFLVVNHMIVFLLSAGIVMMVRSILLKVCDQKVALLGSIIVLALPLYQSQTEAINMELPYLFFSMCSIYYLIQKRIGNATIMAVLSLLVKGHGIISCSTVFIVSMFLFFFDENEDKQDFLKGRKRILCYGGLAIISSVLMAGSKFLLKDQHATGGMMGFLNGLPSLKIMYLPWLYLISFILFFGVVAWKSKKDFLKVLAKKYYPQFVVFIYAGMWFALFLNYTEVSPRYKLALAPYLILCMVFAILVLPKIKRLVPILAFFMVGMTALGSHGFYHFKLKPNYHIFSERSLEYRNDLKMNIQLARFLEENFFEFKIGAPFIMAQKFIFPELGYVKMPMDVMVYGLLSTYDKIPNINITQESIRKTIWIGLAAQVEKRGNFEYPVSKGDYVVKEFVRGENRATLFMGGFAVIQKMKLIFKRVGLWK